MNEKQFKTLIMNDQEPEFASNIKRGLATYLQLNLTGGLDDLQLFNDLEVGPSTIVHYSNYIVYISQYISK